MITKKCPEGGRLLEIDNVHVDDCGVPPSQDASGEYLGYFENRHGEQWVFTGNRKTGEAVVRGGDARWNTEYRISLKILGPSSCFDGEETWWIITCFAAMSYKSVDEILDIYDRKPTVKKKNERKKPAK